MILKHNLFLDLIYLNPERSRHLGVPGSIWHAYINRSIHSMVAQCCHSRFDQHVISHKLWRFKICHPFFLGGHPWRKSKLGRPWCPHGNGMNIFRMLEPGVSWCNAPSPTKYVGVMCWTMPMFWALWLNTLVPRLWWLLCFFLGGVTPAYWKQLVVSSTNHMILGVRPSVHEVQPHVEEFFFRNRSRSKPAVTRSLA